MNARTDNLASIRRVVLALGGDAERAVLAGAAAAATYELLPIVGEIRRTQDVDFVVEVRTLAEYHRLVERLRKKGVLKNVLDGPICRYVIDEQLTDLMPIREEVLGFSNRWYAEACKQCVLFRLDDQTSVRVISPIYFVATKIEAFLDPARADHGDFLGSHDLEDLLTVLIGAPTVVDEIAQGAAPVHASLRATLREFLKRPDFRDAIDGQLPHAFQASTRQEFAARLESAVQESTMRRP